MEGELQRVSEYTRDIWSKFVAGEDDAVAITVWDSNNIALLI